MAIVKKLYAMNVGGGTVKIRLPSYYDKVNQYLGLVAADENTPGRIARHVNDLFLSGDAIKIRTRRKVGSKYITTDLLCDINNAANAVGNLPGKTLGEGTKAGTGEIISAYFKQRRRLG